MLLALVPTTIEARGSNEASIEEDQPVGAKVRITGILKVKGHMPFAELVLETADSGDFVLAGPGVEDLAENHRLETLTVIGTIIDEGNEIQPPTIEVRCFKEYRQ